MPKCFLPLRVKSLNDSIMNSSFHVAELGNRVAIYLWHFATSVRNYITAGQTFSNKIITYPVEIDSERGAAYWTNGEGIKNFRAGGVVALAIGAEMTAVPAMKAGVPSTDAGGVIGGRGRCKISHEALPGRSRRPLGFVVFSAPCSFGVF
jgi:hypothetical protein